jgi:hypothetical protein
MSDVSGIGRYENGALAGIVLIRRIPISRSRDRLPWELFRRRIYCSFCPSVILRHVANVLSAWAVTRLCSRNCALSWSGWITCYWMTWRRHYCNAVCGEGVYDCHAQAQGLGFKHPTLPLRRFLEILGVRKLSYTLSLSLLKRLPVLAGFYLMLCAAPYLSQTVSMRWCFSLSLIGRTTEELSFNDVTKDYEPWWQGVQPPTSACKVHQGPMKPPNSAFFY